MRRIKPATLAWLSTRLTIAGELGLRRAARFGRIHGRTSSPETRLSDHDDPLGLNLEHGVVSSKEGQAECALQGGSGGMEQFTVQDAFAADAETFTSWPGTLRNKHILEPQICTAHATSIPHHSGCGGLHMEKVRYLPLSITAEITAFDGYQFCDVECSMGVGSGGRLARPWVPELHHGHHSHGTDPL